MSKPPVVSGDTDGVACAFPSPAIARGSPLRSLRSPWLWLCCAVVCDDSGDADRSVADDDDSGGDVGGSDDDDDDDSDDDDVSDDDGGDGGNGGSDDDDDNDDGSFSLSLFGRGGRRFQERLSCVGGGACACALDSGVD